MQQKSSDDYNTVETFTIFEKHTSDQCKTLKFQYQSTLNRTGAVNPSFLDGGTYDTLMNNSISLSELQKGHSIHTSFNNSIINVDTSRSNGEPLYEDPGHIEDNIYGWLKRRNIATLKLHNIK